jgi:hypothetical protein
MDRIRAVDSKIKKRVYKFKDNLGFCGQGRRAAC